MNFNELIQSDIQFRIILEIKDKKERNKFEREFKKIQEQKRVEAIEQNKEQSEQTIRDWKSGKITKEEAEDIINPPATKLGRKWREEFRKKK